MRENAKRENAKRPAERKPIPRVVVHRGPDMNDPNVIKGVLRNFLGAHSMVLEEKHHTITSGEWRMPATEEERREHLKELRDLGETVGRIRDSLGALDVRAYPDKKRALHAVQDGPMNVLLGMGFRIDARIAALKKHEIPKKRP